MPGDDVDGLFRADLLPQGAGDSIRQSWADLAPEMDGCDELGAFQVLEIRSSLPDELLMYADKLSMAHGLEVRVPYLDKEVVEFAERLPARFKIRAGRRKWLHRKVCEAFLPRAILARKKRGFAVNVVDEWFHRSLDSRMGRYLLDDDSSMFRFLNPRLSAGWSTSIARAATTTTRCCSASSCSRNGFARTTRRAAAPLRPRPPTTQVALA